MVRRRFFSVSEPGNPYSKGGKLRSNAFVSGMPVRKLICVCARRPISTWWIQAVLAPSPNPKQEICNTALDRFVH